MVELHPLTPGAGSDPPTSNRGADGRDLMKRTSRLLSAFSNQVGLVVAPGLDEAGLKRVELVRAGKGRVLAVIISDRPLVHHRIVASEMDPTQVELDQMSRALNELVSGLNLRQLRARIEEETRRTTAIVCSPPPCAGRDAIAGSPERCTWRAGEILDQPGFLDVERTGPSSGPSRRNRTPPAADA
jgi:hypothetical protein